MTRLDAKIDDFWERGQDWYHFWMDTPATGGVYTLTCTQASFTLTGNNANLVYGRTITTTQRSYALTGINVSLAFGRTLTATKQNYVETGNNTSLVYGRILTATKQNYTLTGYNVTLTFTSGGAYSLIASVANFALTGNNALLTWSGMIPIELFGGGQLVQPVRRQPIYDDDEVFIMWMALDDTEYH